MNRDDYIAITLIVLALGVPIVGLLVILADIWRQAWG